MKRTLATLAAVAALTMSLAACGGTTATGYYKASTLSTSIKDTYNSDSNFTSSEGTVSSVSVIVNQKARTAKALLTLSDGTQTAVDITIDAAGDNWISS
jgi:outer membrane lipopolysaccharide assembly protein LptE/RlpB